MSKQKTSKGGSTTNEESKENGNGFVLEGKNIKAIKKEEVDQVEEFFENRIIKPLPDYSYSPELKELAMTI